MRPTRADLERGIDELIEKCGALSLEVKKEREKAARLEERSRIMGSIVEAAQAYCSAWHDGSDLGHISRIKCREQLGEAVRNYVGYRGHPGPWDREGDFV